MTPSPPSGLGWSDAYLVGDPAMDDVHREFAGLLDALVRAPDDELLSRLDAVAVHADAHFADENRRMAQSGFPARACHAGEHDAVLASIRAVRERLAQGGDKALCRELATRLADWFPAHTTHLDSALAHWLCKTRLGGKPVVLRRDVLDTMDQSLDV